jgi:hypothetical protein
MAELLRWANNLNHSIAAFAKAQEILEKEKSVTPCVIRRSKTETAQS